MNTALPEFRLKESNDNKRRPDSRWSARALLLWLVLATLLPGFIGATALLVLQYQDGRHQLEQQTVQTARALVQAIDNEILRVQALAEGLASVSKFAQGDLAGFHAQARETIKQANLGLAVILTDRSGQQVLNTFKEYGEPLSSSGIPDVVHQVFETGRPAVSKLFVSRTFHRPVMAVGVPVLVRGEVAYALTIPVLPEQFGAILAAQQLPSDWVVTVLDSSATIVARSRANDQFMGKKPRQEFLDRFMRNDQSVVESTTLEGIPSLTAFVRSRETGWGIGIAYALEFSQAPLVRHIVVLAGGLVVLCLLCFALAWSIAKRIARSFEAIKGQAVALGQGSTTSMPLVDVREAEEAATAIARAVDLLAQRQAALGESEERFRLLGDNIAQLAWLADGSGRIYWYNRRWFDYTGTTLEEMQGIGWQKVYHPDSVHQVAAKFNDHIGSGEPWEDVFQLRGKDGEYRWFLSRASPEKDAGGKVIRWFGTNTDITQQRQTEQDLRDSEKRFRATFEQAAVGVAQVGLDGRWLQVNQRLCDIVGYTYDELTKLTFQDLTYPEDLEANLGQIPRLLSGEISHYSTEKRYVRHDGSIVWIDLTVALVRNEKEEPDYFISVIEDISRRKEIEDELQAVNADLENRVETRTAELTAANEELEAITYVTSHDLRGPLGRINSFSTLLELNCRDRLEGENLYFLTLIRQNATRVLQLVDDLLIHARVAQHTLELQTLDVCTVALAVVQEKTGEAREKGVEICMKLPPAQVRADYQALDQVLSSLVENAIKYSSTVASPVVEIGGEPVGNYFRLWVRDNGIGFDMKYHDKIFQMFHRLHTYTEYQGSGIGLALVKRAMERMGGKVWAESTPGKGSTFFLELHSVSHVEAQVG